MSRRLRIDPHVHTEASYDATGTVDAVLDRAREAGLDAIAITDHDTTVAAREAIGRAALHEVAVIPGVEVSSRDGHVLALGIVERPPVGRSLEETLEFVRDAGGLGVIPHPFQRSRHGVPKRALTDCDGVEVFNPWTMTGIQNHRARRFARRRNYPRLAGSDAHEPALVGRAYTEVEIRAPSEPGPHRPSPDAILDAIADGRTTVTGRSTSTQRYLRKYSRSVGRHILNTVQ